MSRTLIAHDDAKYLVLAFKKYDDGSMFVWDEEQETSISYKSKSTELGQLLIDENYKIYELKYGENFDIPPKIDFELTPSDRLYTKITPVQTLKIIDFYLSQTRWEGMDDHVMRIIRKIQTLAIQNLKDYDDAEWGF